MSSLDLRPKFNPAVDLRYGPIQTGKVCLPYTLVSSWYSDLCRWVRKCVVTLRALNKCNSSDENPSTCWPTDFLVSSNDVKMKQSEVTKCNIASACNLARKMCWHRLIVSGPLPIRGSDKLYSRLAQLNRWLKSVFSPSQKIEFVDNWPSFWDSPTNRTKPDLLRSDGLHPSWRGALILSTNIYRALTPLAPQ